MTDLDLEQLTRLARVLGASAGLAFARAIEAAEQAARVEPPPTKAQALLLELRALLPEWVRDARQVPRQAGSAQARMLKLAADLLAAEADEKADATEAGEQGAAG